MSMPTSITKKQKRILDAIHKHVTEHGFTPSYREIATELQLASPATVYDHIQKLKKKGYLSSKDRSARSVVIREEPTAPVQVTHQERTFQPSSDVVALPLKGTIAAGQPIEAVEEHEPMVVPSDMVVDHQNSYVLKVKGDSMKDEGILDGDYVVVERNPSPHDGDVVVALLDNTYATLKRFYREAHRIRLQPANKDLQPIYCYDPLIQGIVRAVIRRYSTA